jgi:hypothetical protein
MSAGMPTMSWSVSTRSPATNPTLDAKPASPAPSDARECTTAFGWSVVPDVKMTNAGALEFGASADARLGRRVTLRRDTAPRGTPGSQGPA